MRWRIHAREAAWHRNLRRKRQVLRWKIWLRRKKVSALGPKRKVAIRLGVLENHHSVPRYSRKALDLNEDALTLPWVSHRMWACTCGAETSQYQQWCSGCNVHYSRTSWWTPTRPTRPSTQRWGRSASRPRKGKGKGSKSKASGKNQETTAEEKEREVARAFQPFTSSSSKSTGEPWQVSTPSTKLAKPTNNGLREEGEEEKEATSKPEVDEAEEEEMRDHAKALMDKTSLPTELRQALVKFIARPQQELKHSDLNKLRRLRVVITKGKQRIEDMDHKWMNFAQICQKNWIEQRKRFIAERQEELNHLRQNQERLGFLQKELASKASAEDLTEEEEIQDTDELMESMPPAPWEVELPEGEEEELSAEEIDKGSKAMQPFGRPAKKAKVDKEKGKKNNA